jgi:(+)-trans-carveol dehydrogenase
MKRFEDKVVFVTGAARGQGRSHCIRLAEEGASIIAADICEAIPIVQYDPATAADLNETVSQVEAAGGKIVASAADVRDKGSLAQALDKGIAEFGGLDVVLANAGIAHYPNGALSIGEADWQTVLDINLTGVWNTCKVALPRLEERGGGSIVLTGSTCSLKGYGSIVHYVAAKHGVMGLTKSLALEFGMKNIRVNSVHPGTVDTPMIHSQLLYKLFCPDKETPTVEDFSAAMQATHIMPLPWVEVSDVTNAVLFLASDEARAMTGVALPVDLGEVLM